MQHFLMDGGLSVESIFTFFENDFVGIRMRDEMLFYQAAVGFRSSSSFPLCSVKRKSGYQFFAGDAVIQGILYILHEYGEWKASRARTVALQRNLVGGLDGFRMELKGSRV